jgi:hypothetical protein
VADKRASNLCKFGYLCSMKPASQLVPVELEKLKPVLHDKIERMDGQHLALVSTASCFNWKRRSCLNALVKPSIRTMSKGCCGAFLNW